MTIQHPPADPESEHAADRWLPAEPGTYEHLRPPTTRVVVAPGTAADPETDLIVTLGLPHLVRVLQDILDSIDERLGFAEKRLDLGQVPMPMHGIDDADAERYFALYSLLHVDSERFRGGTEQDRSGGGAHA